MSVGQVFEKLASELVRRNEAKKIRKNIGLFLRELGLPSNTEYVLTAGTSLFLHGLKDRSAADDIDLYIPDMRQGHVEMNIGEAANLEAYSSWMGFGPRLMAKRQKKYGLWVSDLETEAAYKSTLNKPKHQRDARMIRQHLSQGTRVKGYYRGGKFIKSYYRKSPMKKEAATATKTDPGKWEQAKRDAKARMGGKHSARAMQLATQLYKKRGGGYSGAKPTAKSNSLKKWTKQKWKWSGGAKDRGVYLPSSKVERLKSSKEGRKKLIAAGRKKSEATREGRQYSRHGLAANTSLRKTAMKNPAERLAEHIIGPRVKANEVLNNEKLSPAAKRKVLAELRKRRTHGKTKEANRRTLIVKLAKNCGSHGKKMPSYDKGGRIKSDGYLTDKKGKPYARVHKGEHVVPHSDTEARIMKALTDEGGAAGMKAIKKHVDAPDLKKALASLMAKRKIFKHEDGDIIKKAERDPRLERAGVSGYNKPKRTPNHPTKSHIVVAKEGDKVKTIRFGQQGVKTNQTAGQRKAFKSRHARNIARGKMSAAYWADKAKWSPSKTKDKDNQRWVKGS